MASTSAQIVDLNSYREARGKASKAEATPVSGIPPMIMWVPVWAYFPIMPGMWFHGQ